MNRCVNRLGLNELNTFGGKTFITFYLCQLDLHIFQRDVQFRWLVFFGGKESIQTKQKRNAPPHRDHNFHEVMNHRSPHGDHIQSQFFQRLPTL